MDYFIQVHVFIGHSAILDMGMVKPCNLFMYLINCKKKADEFKKGHIGIVEKV